MKAYRLQPYLPLMATFGVMAALYVFGAVTYTHFASAAVLRNLLVDNAFLGVAAIGATFVILSGGIDLSVSSVMAFTTILIASMVERWHIHPGAAFAAAIALGTLFGMTQGFLIATFDLPSFLVTLAGMFFARGAAFAVHPQSVGIYHPFIATTLNDTLSVHLMTGPRAIVLPITVFALITLEVMAWVVLRHMRFGRAVHAVGDDVAASALMGLSVRATRVRVYALSGGLSALAGVFFTLYQQSGDPASCKGMELDVIAAVIIGGTLLKGGVGSVIGTFFGVLILGLIQTIIMFQGNLSSWWTRIVAAGLMLLFLLVHRQVDRLARRITSRRIGHGPT